MKSNLSILVVDDNPADFNLFKRFLSKGPLREAAVVHSQCARDAIENIKQNHFDCVVLDYRLGVDDGVEVLREINTIQSHLPVIMMTGEGDEVVAVTAMKHGAMDYIPKKDLSTQRVFKAINSALEKSALKRELREKQEELEDFAFTAAHDIKAPFAIVNQTSQLIEMKAELSGDDELKEYATILNDTSLKISNFIGDLLKYAQAGRSNIEFEQVSLEKVLEEAQENLSALIDEHDIQITSERPHPVIAGDAVALVQLFQNILGNSIKYRKKNQKSIIQVTSENLEDSSRFAVRVSIADNGIGMDEVNHKKMFAPLTRFVGKDEYEGAGLGLAIVKKIMDQHAGKIEVESKLEEGTTILLYFN